MKDRDKMAARIRALLSKTVENGCTEGEAVAAASKAAEMLERYNLTTDEVELRQNPFDRHTEFHTDLVGDRLWKVADGIAHLTGCRYWTSRPGISPVEINFFGFAHEVEIAKYLLAICRYAMQDRHDAILARYILLRPDARKRKLLPFLDGMADTLRRRIRDLKPQEPTGTGLVILRNDLIDAALKDAGIGISNRQARGSRDFLDGYDQGVREGERVSLNRGVGTSSSVTFKLT